jgi:phosphoglycerate dehydrogenase-like enzyme
LKAVLQYRASRGLTQLIADVRPSWLDIRVVDPVETVAFSLAMRDADALLHVLAPVSAADIAAAPRLKLIQKIGVGVNTIDLAAAVARGIAVANMPGTNSQAVAEHTLGLMLAVLRRIPQLDAQTRLGDGASAETASSEPVGEIHGRVVGFVGFGQIPQRLAPIIEALGGHVIYANRTVRADVPYRHVSVEDLLAGSDIVSLHLPLTTETARIIDRSAFSRMRRGAVLVNTARGELLDEDALVQSLRSGHLAGAALDVLVDEPARAGHALFALPNVVITPHVAWLTPETLRRSLEVAIHNCQNILQGQPLLHRVV